MQSLHYFGDIVVSTLEGLVPRRRREIPASVTRDEPEMLISCKKEKEKIQYKKCVTFRVRASIIGPVRIES